MAVSEQDIIPGYDPTAQSSVTAAQLYQMVAEAGLNDDKGIIIISNDTPDTGTFPKFKKYLWIKPSENGKITRVWNEGTSSWEAQSLGAGAVGTAELANNAVTLAKLYAPGVPEAGKQLTVLPDGTFGLVLYVPPVQSIELSDINHGEGEGNEGFFLRVKADDSGFELIDLSLALSSYILDGSIELDKLYFAAAFDSIIYRTKEVDGGDIIPVSIHAIPTLWENGVVAVTKITPGAPNTALYTNGLGIVGWQPSIKTAMTITDLSGPITDYEDSVLSPTNHLLGGIPNIQFGHIYLLPSQTDLDYVVGDYLNIEHVASSKSADGMTTPAFTLWFNATQWGGYCGTNGGAGGDIYIRHKTTGVWTAIDKSKWFLRVTHIRHY